MSNQNTSQYEMEKRTRYFTWKQQLEEAQMEQEYQNLISGEPAEPEVLWSEVCGHRVRYDVYSHCGCLA